MRRTGWLAVFALLALAPGVDAAGWERLRLWQTNSGGDTIHIFDLETGGLVRRLAVGPEPDGIGATADGKTVFVTVEASGRAAGELVWIDAASSCSREAAGGGQASQAQPGPPSAGMIKGGRRIG